MTDHIADVMVHVNESLDEATLRALEDEMFDNVGVVAVGHNPRRPHLMLVAFDPEVAMPASFLQPLRGHGLHAQLVGF
ncbi:MAG: hypothetical protein H6935_15735 [Thiobacillus sp.]|nr:hypothetical protein [Thiobacillus sp.]